MKVMKHGGSHVEGDGDEPGILLGLLQMVDGLCGQGRHTTKAINGALKSGFFHQPGECLLARHVEN